MNGLKSSRLVNLNLLFLLLSFCSGCASYPNHKFKTPVSINPPVNITSRNTVFFEKVQGSGTGENVANQLEHEMIGIFARKGVNTVDHYSDKHIRHDYKIVARVLKANYDKEIAAQSGFTDSRGYYRETTFHRASAFLTVEYIIFREGTDHPVMRFPVKTYAYAGPKGTQSISPGALFSRCIEENVAILEDLTRKIEYDHSLFIALVDDHTKELLPLLENQDYRAAIEHLEPNWNKVRKKIFLTSRVSSRYQWNLAVLHELAGDYPRAIDYYIGAYEIQRKTSVRDSYLKTLYRCYLKSGGRASYPVTF